MHEIPHTLSFCAGRAACLAAWQGDKPAARLSLTWPTPETGSYTFFKTGSSPVITL